MDFLLLIIDNDVVYFYNKSRDKCLILYYVLLISNNGKSFI